MATTTARPNGTFSNVTFLNESSSSSNPHLSVDEAVDSSDGDTTYIGATNTNTIRLQLDDMPSDFSVATACTIRLRARNTGTKGDAGFVSATYILESDGTTQITAAGGSAVLTSSYATYDIAKTITGATSKTKWDGAILLITTAGADSQTRISSAEVVITYTASVAGGGGSTTSKVHKMLLGDK